MARDPVLRAEIRLPMLRAFCCPSRPPEPYVFALLLFGSRAAKLLMALTIKRSKYFPFVLGSGILSAAMGIMVLANWSGISASLIGVVLGLELLADALVMGALAWRDRDREEAMEEAGLDPAAGAVLASKDLASGQ